MLIILAIVVAALGAAVVAFILRGQSYTPVSTGDPDFNATEPYHVEMRCIDGVLRNRALKAEEVQPALDRCRAVSWGGTPGTKQ